MNLGAIEEKEREIGVSEFISILSSIWRIAVKAYERRAAMIYTFSCPVPCQRLICVDARNDEEAVVKFIGAGAMLCRSGGTQGNCPMVHPDMAPLPDMRLREIVRMSMRSGA